LQHISYYILLVQAIALHSLGGIGGGETGGVAPKVEGISSMIGATMTREKIFSTPYLPQPTRLTPQKIEEKKEKGLCYNCDSKYT
jgi:hypothetical protein